MDGPGWSRATHIDGDWTLDSVAKSHDEELPENFVAPLIVSTFGTAIIYWADVYNLQTHIANTKVPFGEVPLGRVPLAAELTGVCPDRLWGVFFVTYTLLVEYMRAVQVRARSVGESAFKAMYRIVGKQKRRYGGYLTHLGFAGLFLGFIGTGLKIQKDLSFPSLNATHRIADKQLTFVGLERSENRDILSGLPFDLHQIDENGEVGEYLGILRPARRAYHGANVRLSRQTTEKDEIFMWKGNVYLSIVSFSPRLQTCEVSAHYYPMILFMWLGGALLLFGVAVVLWPDPVAYPVFAAAHVSAKPNR